MNYCDVFKDIVKLLNWSGWCMKTLKLEEKGMVLVKHFIEPFGCILD